MRDYNPVSLFLYTLCVVVGQFPRPLPVLGPLPAGPFPSRFRFCIMSPLLIDPSFILFACIISRAKQMVKITMAMFAQRDAVAKFYP